MIAVSLNNVSLVLGARPIFRQLSWEIQHDQRIGLIGADKARITHHIGGENGGEASCGHIGKIAMFKLSGPN